MSGVIVYPEIAGTGLPFAGSVIYSGDSSGAPPASASLVGKRAWFTDKPTAQGGAFVVRESSGTPGTYIYDRVDGGVIVADMLANCNANYNMTTYDGCTFRVTDIGASGYDFVATGGYLRPKNNSSTGIQLFAKDFGDVATAGYLLIAGNGGTYSQSGNIITVSLTGHTLPATEFNGCNVHLTIATGTALTGWYTNFQQTGADTFQATSTASLSTNGNLAANTSDTDAPWSYTVPAGLIKRKDSLALSSWVRSKATAGNKTLKWLYSGTQVSANTLTSTAAWTFTGPSAQYFVGGDASFITTGASTTSTDTNRTYTLRMVCATNTDWVFALPTSLAWGPRYGL